MYYAFIATAAVLWGLDGVLRRQTYSLPATVVVFWEHVIGLAILLIIPRLIRSYRLPRIHGKSAFQALIVVALFSGVVGTVAFTAALQQVQFIPLSIVFFIQKIQPIFTIISARIVLKERPHKLFWAWAVVALVASYFLTFPSGTFVLTYPLAPTMVAALLAFVAALAWGTSTVFSKIALKSNDLYSVTTYRFLLTLVFALPAVFLTQSHAALFKPSLTEIAILCLIALSTGMVGVVIYYKGLKRVPAHISCILELAFPLTGLIVDVFFYHTPFSITQIVAGAVLTFVMFQIVRLPTYAHRE